ncbi:hypothetical protein GCM10029978_004350 [Actinoallomurus acanthiterrae]
MLSHIHKIAGKTLDVAAYHAIRRAETRRLTRPIWKLERSQHFHEPDDDPSWQAFVADDWPRVLAVFESERADARAEVDSYARQGTELRRLRIVERPVSRYLLWEMQWFRILAEEGTAIRVLDAEHVRAFERDGVLPEIVVDEHALYHVRYDKDWRPCGARRIDDPDVMRGATEEIAALWELAEPFSRYFTREIMTLLPSTP